MSAHIDLYSDRRFELSFTWRRTTVSTGATETESEMINGRYEITGSTIEFDPDDLSDEHNIGGTISSNDITVTEDGMTFLFRK